MENKINIPQEEQQFTQEEQLQQIQQTMENESDDWFLNQIIDNTQPDFWWVY